MIGAARIAGIMAAKRTHELIPLCHPLAITKATSTSCSRRSPPGIRVTAEVKVSGQTGVEMEALTAVSVACLTLYDMLKAADRAMIIEGVRLIEKTAASRARSRLPPEGQEADLMALLPVAEALARIFEGAKTLETENVESAPCPWPHAGEAGGSARRQPAFRCLRDGWLRGPRR